MKKNLKSKISLHRPFNKVMCLKSLLSRSGTLKQKISWLSEVSQRWYWPARLHRLVYVAWQAGRKSANLTQPCLKLRLQCPQTFL